MRTITYVGLNLESTKKIKYDELLLESFINEFDFIENYSIFKIMEDKSLLVTLINEVLGQPLKVNKHRGQYAYICPVCSSEKGQQEDKAKLEVNVFRGVYKCWVCHETHETHGSIQKLLYKFGGRGIKSKLKKLGLEFKIDKNKNLNGDIVLKKLELPEGFIRFEDANPKSMMYKQGWSYLTKQRKLTPKIIHKYQMGYTEHKDYLYRIIIPSYDKDGELNYFTARSWLENPKLRYKNPDVPRETIIFNEHLVNWDGTIYIVEGPLDHVVVPNSIPLLGKDIHDKLIRTIMDRCTGHVVILLDGEEKVWGISKKIYTKLNVGKMYGRVRIIKLTNNMDIGEINEKYGTPGVVDVLRSSYKLKESTL